LLNHPDLAQDVLETHGRKFEKGGGSEKAKRLLGEGLLVSGSEIHDRQREIMEPLFTAEAVKAYADVVVPEAVRVSGQWTPGQQVDVFEHMLRITSNVIMLTLTGHLDQAEADRIALALAQNAASFWRLFLPFSRTMERLPLRGSRRAVEARRTVDEFLFDRIARGHSGNDSLLAKMLAAPAHGSAMADRQARDESMNLFLAARATTATGLTWTWYLLSQNPEAEERLHKEVDEVLGERAPTAEDLSSLTYTRMVFAESLRLLPPAWVLKREALQDHELAGYHIPAGSTVITSPYVVHRDARFWPDPTRYDPERFAPQSELGRHPYAYFPFAGGPKRCLGDDFAWMEATLVLATVARKWQARLVPGHRVELSPRVTLKPKYGMQMVLEERKLRRAVSTPLP
jgi:cytochrome P450